LKIELAKVRCMIEKDAVLSKISIIKNRLDRIKKVTKLKPDSLNEYDKQDIFVLNLQRAIQAATDIANLIISANQYRLPNSYKMAFHILFENGWIESETSKLMQKMVGFRNIAIHDYQEIDVEILKSILIKKFVGL